jgi:Asp/Glu/hydantoin racemase
MAQQNDEFGLPVIDGASACISLTVAHIPNQL